MKEIYSCEGNIFVMLRKYIYHMNEIYFLYEGNMFVM